MVTYTCCDLPWSSFQSLLQPLLHVSHASFEVIPFPFRLAPETTEGGH